MIVPGWIDEKITIILTRSEDFIQRRLLAVLVWDPRKCHSGPPLPESTSSILRHSQGPPLPGSAIVIRYPNISLAPVYIYRIPERYSKWCRPPTPRVHRFQKFQAEPLYLVF